MNAAAANRLDRVLGLSEIGLLPDNIIRHGIRRLLRTRLDEIGADDGERVAANRERFIDMMNASEIAPVPDVANDQHYEVPAAFFEAVLGRRLKYSCGHWADGATSLNEAELGALTLTAERAQLADGQSVLDLGCGWGSFSLWAAERYPGSRFTAVSNSRSQREFIVAEVGRRELDNVEVLTRDMNRFAPETGFDRVVSIEMFEHMRNYGRLFEGISSWLNPGGRFFMHIFCHRSCPYEFADEGPGDWMARHFFAGGIMPSDDLPSRFQDHLRLMSQWRWDGLHYEKTANAWLENMDRRKDVIMPVIHATYGAEHASQWWTRWRIFFMACAELFGYAEGQEWWVSHYLFESRSET